MSKILALSDEELATLRRPCAHVWGMEHRAPDLRDVVGDITYNLPQWGRFQRYCKCGATQFGYGNEWGGNIKWEAV